MEKSIADRGGQTFNFSVNSLDLVRIVAAAQVAIFHVWTRSFPSDSHGFVVTALQFLPGVPVFFFISGFVITGAWNRDPNIARYTISRAFRIFPAYYLAFLFSLTCILILFGDGVANNSLQMAMWVGAQLRMLPSWNPNFLREYGTGVVNASLWTIPVEAIFYVCTAAILIVGSKIKQTTPLLIFVCIVSLLINVYAHHLMPTDTGRGVTLMKVLTVSPLSFISWIWMFCLGSLASIWFQTIIGYLVRWFYAVVGLFILSAAIGWAFPVPGLLRPFGNNVGLINMLAMAALILSFAFRYSSVGRRLLKGNDYSYGLYLFHLPVLNVLIELGYSGWTCFLLALTGGLTMAILSWSLVEKPMLQRGKLWRDSLKLSTSVRADRKNQGDSMIPEKA